MLPVPYISQIEEGRLAINDCGPASALMVARAYGHALATSIDDLYRRHGYPDTGLYVSTIAALLASLGVPNTVLRGGMSALRRWVDERRPPILLVDATRLRQAGLTRPDISGGHFVVVVGYEGDDIVVHDPYQTQGRGAFARWPAAALDRAWQPHGQYAYVAIVPNQPLPQEVNMADITKARQAIAEARRQLADAAAALADGETPAPETVTVRRNVNFRAQPSTGAPVHRLLLAGETLTKLGETAGEHWGGSSTWYRLRDRQGVEGYAHGSFF